MKNTFLIVISFLIFGCGSVDDKFERFKSNFQKLKLPITTAYGKFINEKPNNQIEKELLEVFNSTIKNDTCDCDYFYLGMVPFPEKPFDIYLIKKKDNKDQNGLTNFIYTFSKDGVLIDSEMFSDIVFGIGYDSYLESSLFYKHELEFFRMMWKREYKFDDEVEDSYVEEVSSFFKITADGQIEPNGTSKPNDSPPTKANKDIAEFLSQFENMYLPFDLKDEGANLKGLLRLKGFDFFKKEFPQEELYSDEIGEPDDEYDGLPRRVGKLYSQKNFDAFVIYVWDNADIYRLYTISKDGKIIDEITLMESSGTDGETYDIESSISAYDPDTIKIMTVASHYYNDRENNTETIDEELNRYKIEANGKISLIKSTSLKSEYLSSEDTEQIFIQNDGIGNVKVGMKVSDLNKRILGLTAGIQYTDPNQGVFTHLKNDEISLMFNDYKLDIYEILIHSKYKTEKGIGVGSTVAELKEAHNFTKVELDQGEGEPWFVLKIDDLPNIGILINQYAEEDDWSLGKEELYNKISDTAKIQEIVISDRN